MFAMSDAAWGFAGVLVAQVVILIGIYVNSHRTRQDVKMVNRAVNHQGPDAPTLVERTCHVESEVSWLSDVVRRVAIHVGLTLPAHPQEDNQ